MSDVQEYENNEFVDNGLIQQQTSEIIKEVLDVSNIIELVDEYLSGEKIIQTQEDGKIVFKKVTYTEPKINEKGRYEIKRHLQLRLSKIFSLTDYDDKIISNNLRVFGKDFLMLLVICKKEYNLKSVYIPTLFNEVFDAVQATMRKSKSHMYIDFLKQSSKTVETRMFGNNSKDSGSELFKKRRN
jgi:hypothetical protein